MTTENEAIIQTVEKVALDGVLNGFTWQKDLSAFQRRNIIYGWNGGGKSTLGRVLAAFGKEDIGLSEIEVEATTNTGNRKAKPKGDDITEDQQFDVMLFDRSYVDKCIRIIGQTDMELQYELGREGVEVQEKINQLEADCRDAREEIDKITTEQRRVKDEIDKFGSREAATISSNIPRFVAERFRGNKDIKSYNRTKYERDFKLWDQKQQIPNGYNSATSREEYVAAIRAESKERLSTIHLPLQELTNLSAVAQRLAKKVPNVLPMEHLLADSSIWPWVQEGLYLHEQREASSCQFCLAKLPDDWLQKLRAHFNESYRKIQNDADDAVKEVKLLQEKLSKLTLPSSMEVHPIHKSSWDAIRPSFDSAIGELSRILDRILTSLINKKHNPSLGCEVDSLNVSRFEPLKNHLGVLIDQHNAETADFLNLQANQASNFRWHIIEKSATEYKALCIQLEGLNAEVESHQRRLEGLRTEVESLRPGLKERQEFASEVNPLLESYLGHSEIQLGATEAGFRIKRGQGDSHAGHSLSEGESQGIGLLLFLRQVMRLDQESLSNLVVVIDDPVSSLDSAALHSAMSFVRKATENAGQLFVLSHSFEFMRHVMDWFSEAGRTDWGAYEILCSVDAKLGLRRSYLKPMDPLLRKYRSEYHYLFSRCYHMSISMPKEGYGGAVGAANLGRRLLEGFLSAVAPDHGDLRRFQDDVLSKQMVAPGLRKFLNDHSHANGLSNWSAHFAPLAQTPKRLREVLEPIRDINEVHYNSMVALCEAHKPDPLWFEG